MSYRLEHRNINNNNWNPVNDTFLDWGNEKFINSNSSLSKSNDKKELLEEISKLTFNDMPNEIFTNYISKYLNVNDLCSSSLVSKIWYSYVHDDLNDVREKVKKSVIFKNPFRPFASPKEQIEYSRKIENNAASDSDTYKISEQATNKDFSGLTGLNQFLILRDEVVLVNIYGKELTVKNSDESLDIFRGHKDIITDVANFQDFLVSSSRDNTICVWNTEGTEPISNNNTRVWKDLKEAFILDCESPVISIMAFKEVLVSTSADGNARLWLDAKTNQILFHHTPANTSRCVWDENVVLGYMDGKMVATDENGKLIEFKGHVSAISDLAVCDEKLASSSYDLTILVWNKKGQCLNKFKNIGINPKQLMFLQGNVVAGCANDHICIWKEDNTFSSLIVVKPYIKSFDVFGNHIVTSASDGLVQLIDAKGKIYERLGYHKNIDTLKVFGGKIYIASPTGKITVVDYE